MATAIAFLTHGFLVSANFFPNLSEINSWDEAAYINSGRMLLEGEWPLLSNNPLVVGFYSLTYLPYADSAYWMVHSTSLGRMILFGLVWIGAVTVARQLSPRPHWLIMVGLLLVSAIPVRLLTFPSDPLYVGFAALGLGHVLRYLNTEKRKHLWLSSLFVGLAAMARNDGVLLGIGLIVLTVIIARPRAEVWKSIIASALPFMGLVGGYVVILGVSTGRFELGTLERTYDNFEAGQQVVYGGEGQIEATLEAKLEARRIFGTPEDNRNSVFRAILRNPQAYLQRLVAVTRLLPELALAAYGKRLAVPIFLLAARGFWGLLRSRNYRLLIALIVWPLPVLSGFVITLFRIGHLQFPFYVVYGLAGLGLIAAARNLADRREQGYWLVTLLGFSLYGALDAKLAITYGALVMLAALALSLLSRRSLRREGSIVAATSLLLLAGGLVLHGDYPGPKVRTLGEASDEQAVLYLVEHFDQGAPVAAGAPGPVYAARMTYMGLASLDVPRGRTPQEFLDWLAVQGTEAIYVDSSLWQGNPYFWELISSQIGDGLQRVFVAEEGNFQVLLLGD